MIKFALILVLCSRAFAQRPGAGKCPEMNIVKDYQIEKAMGTWYVYARYFVDREEKGKCNKVDLSLNEDGSMKIVRTQIDSDTGTTKTLEGEATFVGKREEAKLLVNFPSIPSSGDVYNLILGTDYISYAVIFSCEQKEDSHAILGWIQTRERFPNEDAISKALDIFEKNGFDINDLKRTNQKDCE